MSRPKIKNYNNQINIKMHCADKLVLKKAFNFFIQKHGAFDAAGQRYSFNEYCLQALRDKAIREIELAKPPHQLTNNEEQKKGTQKSETTRKAKKPKHTG